MRENLVNESIVSTTLYSRYAKLLALMLFSQVLVFLILSNTFPTSILRVFAFILAVGFVYIFYRFSLLIQELIFIKKNKTKVYLSALTYLFLSSLVYLIGFLGFLVPSGSFAFLNSLIFVLNQLSVGIFFLWLLFIGQGLPGEMSFRQIYLYVASLGIFIWTVVVFEVIYRGTIVLLNLETFFLFIFSPAALFLWASYLPQTLRLK